MTNTVLIDGLNMRRSSYQLFVVQKLQWQNWEGNVLVNKGKFYRRPHSFQQIYARNRIYTLKCKFNNFESLRYLQMGCRLWKYRSNLIQVIADRSAFYRHTKLFKQT